MQYIKLKVSIIGQHNLEITQRILKYSPISLFFDPFAEDNFESLTLKYKYKLTN